MSNTIIIALHGGDKKTCWAAICKTADSETCMSQGSIPGSTSLSVPLADYTEWMKGKYVWIF